jgi:putative ABC transport system permease protein
MREDLRSAIRSLRQSPTFTLVALTVIALGIGASTAIFSVVDAVILKGLPFDEHDRLVSVLEHDSKRPTTFGGGSTTTQTYLSWRELQQSFAGLAAVGSTRFRLRNEAGEPADAVAQRVTAEFLDVVRVSPIIGRGFSIDEETQGRHRVVILSYGFWQRQFGGAPDVVGKTLELSEERWEVVGVMPRGFAYPPVATRPTELYVPLTFGEDDRVRGGSRNYNYLAIGRLRPGVTVEQAHAQMNQVAEGLNKEFPKWSDWGVRVVTLHEHLVGRVRAWMLLLLGSVALVLLIACANVANLMVARATVRAREIAIRAALGAGRARLIRGLLVEGVVLSAAGAALGIALAYWGVAVLQGWLPPNLPRVAEIAIDLRVLGAAVAVALATGVFFGLAPALHAARPDLAVAFKEGGRSSTSGRGAQRMRSGLVIGELALAVVLLVGAGLFIRSFANLMSIDPGVDYRNVLTLGLSLQVPPGPQATFRERYEPMLPKGRAYVDQALDAISRMPGVAMAGAVREGVPLSPSWSRSSVTLPGRGELEGDEGSVDLQTVTANYHQLMRIPLRRGRYFGPEDREGAPLAAIVNEAAAAKYWPAEDALGKTFTVNRRERTVVGVVGNVRSLGPETLPRQTAYFTIAQEGTVSANLLIKTTVDPMQVLPAVKAAIWAINPEQRLTQETVTLEGYMNRHIAQRRFNMALLALFGIVGLVIAAAGVYGVMAYIVVQRTGEIGVRMALGASPVQVMRLVLGRAALLTVAGLVIGGAGAWYLGSGVRTFLYEVQPNDLGVFALALLTLTLSALAASAIPALRASRVDPLTTLKAE